MKKALVASLTLNVLIAVLFVGKRYYYANAQPPVITTGYPFDQWNQMRTSLYSICSLDSNDIVFVGNSLTEAFPVTEFFGPNVKNRGIGGNKTTHILQRIAGIAKCKPKKLFIEAGINDLTFGGTVDSAFYNYLQIVNTIQRLSKRTSIYIQSTLPTCAAYEPYNEQIRELNRRLKDYCGKVGLNYIDVYSPMALAAKMDSTLTADGLHLNGKGYEIWATEVRKYIN